MPVPWEALIPFGELVSSPVSPSPVLRSERLTRSGHRTVRRCWDLVKYIQASTKPGQGESCISLSSHINLFTAHHIPAPKISYRLVGGNDDGQGRATHWTRAETDGTVSHKPRTYFLPDTIDPTFVTVQPRSTRGLRDE
jgi:hypothetical protein